MNIVWVDEGNNPDYELCEKHGITGYYFALFDPRLTRDYLTEVATHGAVGTYMAGNWPQFKDKSGTQMAVIVNNRVNEIAGGANLVKPSFPKVQFDLEMHNPDLILACFKRWRQLKPKQDTSWTMESFQAGWMSPVFVEAIVKLHIRVVPQYYRGKMANTELKDSDWEAWCKELQAERVAQDRAFKDLLDVGFPAGLITGFYDAADLPAWWDGFAFTQGRLPR